MYLQTLLLALSAPLLTLASLNTTRSYHLRTCLKPNQTEDKQVYENLYLVDYHTGAGLGDAVLVNGSTNSAIGFLNGTAQEFDRGNDFPWSLELPVTNFYALWQFVQINAGSGGSSLPNGAAFFINETGLQYNTSPDGTDEENEFRGWLVCDWWHGGPQLFWRYDYSDPTATLPKTCADVCLMPDYI